MFLIRLFLPIVVFASSATLCNWLMTWCFILIPAKRILVSIIFITLFLVVLIRQIWRTFRYTQEFLNISPAEFPIPIKKLIAESGIDISNIVLIQSSVPFVFCFGFLHPRICLSTGLINLLSQSQLRATLYHEDFHRQRFDPLQILVIESISTTLFFLPVIHEWRSQAKLKLELNADDYAIHKVGKSSLAGALYRLLTNTPQTQPIGYEISVAGISANEARIAALLGERSVPQSISASKLVLSLAIVWGIICIFIV